MIALDASHRSSELKFGCSKQGRKYVPVNKRVGYFPSFPEDIHAIA